MNPFRFLTAFAVVVTAGQWVGAQSLPDISDVSASASIDASQSQQIEAWASAAVTVIRGGKLAELEQIRISAGKYLASGTASFRGALAEHIANKGTAILGNGSSAQTRTVVGILCDSRSDGAAGALVGALEQQDSGTRFLAAQGLSRLAGSWGEGADQTISRIGQALGLETNALVAAQLCEALQVSGRVDEAGQALAGFMTQRTDLFRERGPSAMGSLRGAIEALDGLVLDQLGTDGKPVVVGAVANLLDYAVRHYTSGDELDASSRDNLERIIDRCEPVLARLLAGNTPAEGLPRAAEAMRTGGEEASSKMRKELDRWLGAGATQGVLNAAPWSLPVGGGFSPITRPER